MQTEWYWAKDGEQFGPLPEADLRERFLSGELPKDTLVWASGMQDWAPAQRVDGLMSEPPPPPPRPAEARAAVAPAVASASGGSVQSQAAVRPEAARNAWSRYAARTIDSTLALGLVFALSGVPALEDTFRQIVAMLASLLLWVVLEPLFLMRSGMTPGKWLFRVRVVHEDGRLLTYGEGLSRTARVLLGGLGLGLPVLNLVMPALAFRELTLTGGTPWDRAVSTVVQHGRMGTAQKAVLGFLLVLFLIALLSQPTVG